MITFNDSTTVSDVTDAYIEFGDDVKVYFDPIYIKAEKPR